MPWTTPPTFADGNILTASQLNILSDDLEYLSGVTEAVNTPFTGLITSLPLTSSNNLWRIRHQHRYLHYRIYSTSGTSDYVKVYYDGEVAYDDSGNRAGPHLWAGYADLDSVAPGLVVGTYYDLWVEADGDAWTLRVEFLGESDSTSL